MLQRMDLISTQVRGLYSSCLEPMEEFSSFMWVDLSEPPDWNHVEACIKHFGGTQKKFTKNVTVMEMLGISMHTRTGPSIVKGSKASSFVPRCWRWHRCSPLFPLTVLMWREGLHWCKANGKREGMSFIMDCWDRHDIQERTMGHRKRTEKSKMSRHSVFI